MPALALDGHITVSLAGKILEKKFDVTDGTDVIYSVDVTWNPLLRADTGKFDLGEDYRAMVTLKAGPGYAFPATVTVTHGGASGSIAAFEDENKGDGTTHGRGGSASR
jgi:hypothetical protein